MLINLSNFHSSSWEDAKTNMAISEFESILDIEFPEIEHNFEEKAIEQLSESYVKTCAKYFCNADRNNAVHIKGENLFTFCFVNSMLKRGFRCISSVSEIKNNSEEGKNLSVNKFVKFREYKLEY